MFIFLEENQQNAKKFLASIEKNYRTADIRFLERLAEEERKRIEEEKRLYVEKEKLAIIKKAKGQGYTVKEKQNGQSVQLVLVRTTY